MDHEERVSHWQRRQHKRDAARRRMKKSGATIQVVYEYANKKRLKQAMRVTR